MQTGQDGDHSAPAVGSAALSASDILDLAMVSAIETVEITAKALLSGPEITLTINRGRPTEIALQLPAEVAARFVVPITLEVREALRREWSAVSPEGQTHAPDARCPLCGVGPVPPAGLVAAFKTGKWPDAA